MSRKPIRTKKQRATPTETTGKISKLSKVLTQICLANVLRVTSGLILWISHHAKAVNDATTTKRISCDGRWKWKAALPDFPPSSADSPPPPESTSLERNEPTLTRSQTSTPTLWDRVACWSVLKLKLSLSKYSVA